MAVTIQYTNFDGSLYLLGGREAIPGNALRVGTGINPIHAHSIRSRNANLRLTTSPVISAVRFSGHTYTTDGTGNVRQDGAIINSGLASGQRTAYVKAPPHFGSPAYLFNIGAGTAFKVDMNGGVTNWGIAAPILTNPSAAIFSSQAVYLDIDDLTDISNLTATGTATLQLDTSDYISSPGSTEITVPSISTGGFSETTALLLNPPNSTDFDTIQFYFKVDKPQYITSITLQFDINSSGFLTNRYEVQVPVGNFIGTQSGASTRTVDDLDSIATSYHNGTPLPTDLSYLQRVYVQNYARYLNFAKQKPKDRPHWHPPKGTLNNQIANGLTVTPAGNNWWLARIPRGSFTQIGAPVATNNWNNVTGFQFFIVNRHTSDTCSVWFNNLSFGSPPVAQAGGGVGMLGDYSYYFTFGNSVSGHDSNPANDGVPLNISQVDRNAVILTGLPTVSSDPQVDTLTIWRTMGNGGIPYRLADIDISTLDASNFDGTFVDCIGDYAGFGPSPSNIPNTMPGWVANTTYAPGTIILPTTNNPGNFCFVNDGPGMSAAAQPVWPQFVGSTVEDNTIDWRNVGTTLLLGLDTMQQLSVLPPLTATSCTFFNGTMFICGDTATGARGRIYFSAAGYAEGVAGYTDISNDDDPTVGFGIYAGNLYVFTQKAVWLVQDISEGPFLPGFSAIRQGTAPGCGSMQSIVISPGGIVYQAPEGGIYNFDTYVSQLIAPQILPILTGDTVEDYGPVGTIVAATYGRNEYWFSDGVRHTFAINGMISSMAPDVGTNGFNVRASSGIASTCLYFEPDTGKILAGWNGGTYHLEEYGQYVADDGTSALHFDLRPASFYSGDKYTAKGQRLLLDANAGGNILSVYVSIDGTDYLLGTATGTARQKYEFTFNMSGSLIGPYITTVGGFGQVEIFRIALEVDVSGQDDVGTGGARIQAANQAKNLIGYANQ